MPNQLHAAPVLLLALALAGPAAEAQAAPELTLGFSRFYLQPTEGTVERLNGGFLAGRLAWAGPWSLVGEAREEAGTGRDGARLRMASLALGPRCSLHLPSGVEAYAHLLVGDARLSDSLVLGTTWRSSLDLSPGAGLDWHPAGPFLVRFQANQVLTYFVHRDQRNVNFSLGLGYRWGAAPRAAALQVEAPPVELPPEPARPASAAPVVPPPPDAAPAPLPAPAPPVAYQVTVRFGPGVWRLGEAERRAILRGAEALKGLPATWSVAVTGHASRIGKGNQRLSEKRARSVTEALVAAGVPRASITLRGASYHEPHAPNDTVANRALNRRAELVPKMDPRVPVTIRSLELGPVPGPRP